MVYTEKLSALNSGLRPIYPDQDRINFAPRLSEDIAVLAEDGTEFKLNKVYTSADTDYPDLAGTVWVVSDIDGWWNLSDSDVPDISRGFGDGSFDVRGRFLARDFTITGSILIESGDRTTIGTKSAAARAQLINIFNLVKRNTWVIVDEDSYRRSAYVRLNGRPNIATVNSKGRIDFSIGLRAGDPLKYEWVEEIPAELVSSGLTTIDGNGYRYAEIVSGSSSPAKRNYTYDTVTAANSYRDYIYDTATSSNSYRQYSGNVAVSSYNSDQATIFNFGDTDVYCLFRIVGPLYGPAVIGNSDTGQEININAPTTTEPLLYDSTTYLDIETKKREVVRGNYASGSASGSSRSLLEPLVDWIYLQPGANTIYFNDSGLQVADQYSSLQIYWRSGWIG